MTRRHIEGEDFRQLHHELVLARKLHERYVEGRGAERLMERLIESLHREKRS
jgi:hypothetical protein